MERPNGLSFALAFLCIVYTDSTVRSHLYLMAYDFGQTRIITLIEYDYHIKCVVSVEYKQIVVFNYVRFPFCLKNHEVYDGVGIIWN